MIHRQGGSSCSGTDPIDNLESSRLLAVAQRDICASQHQSAQIVAPRGEYEQFKTGNRTHAEQAITGSVAHGIDYDDYLAALAPRPVCVGAAASDRYFPIEGVYETVNRVRDIYALYDAEGRVDLVVGQTTNCAVYELRDGVFEFLCDHLSDDTYDTQADISVLDESETRCTPDGSVHSAYPNEHVDYVIKQFRNREMQSCNFQIFSLRIR
ncbi:hypothetical protein [Halorussus amylolyticus]|uniref:hypothetical protein n=1 Tax=Halorussus amylolyticus TaxID=1126242 RepID=UPI00104415A4|nr:hypothetical protein [Halorussus amylolyticus]